MICFIQVAQIKVSVQYWKVGLLLFVKTYQRRRKKKIFRQVVRTEMGNAIKNPGDGTCCVCSSSALLQPLH